MPLSVDADPEAPVVAQVDETPDDDKPKDGASSHLKTLDPYSQSDLLRQALSQGKTHLGIFLGAGCPASIKGSGGAEAGPLIPDISGITARVSDEMAETDAKEKYQLVLDQLKSDGNPAPNVEHVLTHVRLLRQAAGSEGARNLSVQDLTNLDDLISRVIVKVVNQELPEGRTPYDDLAVWASSVSRDHSLQLFTTNYDLLIEQALEANRAPYFDGFIGTRKPFFDPYAMEADQLPPRWSRLWKLHGSINWEERDGNVVRLSASEVSRANLIHPSHLKYDENRRMPYLAMIDRLRDFFARTKPTLVTCGFAFRDQHLNEVFDQGLRGNPTAHVFALMYGALNNYPESRKLAEKRPNLSVLAKDSCSIGTRRYAWSSSESSPDQDSHDAASEQSTTHFTLGDFAEFGTFLRDIVGDRRHD